MKSVLASGPAGEMVSRSPHGERGLKSQVGGLIQNVLTGRSPHGERGLKFRCAEGLVTMGQSLPSRGAWIEIPC